MKTLGVGIIGYGFMGKTHTYGYKSLPLLYEPTPAKIRLVGVAVRSLDSQRLAVEQGGFEFATADYRDLLNRDDIDVIDCCTPNDSHHEIIMAAIEAGKHIYVDKPLAAGLDQAREIVKAAESADFAGKRRTRQMAHNYRFAPAVMRAKELVDEGRIGRVYTFAFRYIHSSNADPSKPLHWKTDWNVGGGVWVDLGSHIIDLAHYLLGPFARVLSHPVTVFKQRPDGKGGMADVNGDDACFAIAETSSGAVGTLEASKMAVGANDELTIEIRGEKGALLFNLMDPNWLRFFDNTVPERPLGGLRGFTQIECVQRYHPPAALPGPKLAVGWMRFHIHSIYDFVRRVVDNEPGNPSLYDGLATHYVIDASYRNPGVWTDIKY